MASTLIILNNNLKSKSQISLSNPTNTSSSPISDSNSSSTSSSTVTTPTSGIDPGTSTSTDMNSSQLTNSYTSTNRKYSNNIPPIPSSAPVVLGSSSYTPSATPITKVINNTIATSKNNLNNSIVTIINKNSLNSNIHEALNNNTNNNHNLPSLSNGNELTNSQKLYISTHHFKLTKSSSQDFIERNENIDRQQMRIKSCLASIPATAPVKNYRSLPKPHIDSDDSDDKNDEQEIAKIEDEKHKLDQNSNTSSDASSISDTLMPSSSSSSAVSSGTSSPSASPTTTSKVPESTNIDSLYQQDVINSSNNPKKIKFSSFLAGDIANNSINNNKNESLIQVEPKEEEVDVSKSIETVNLKEQAMANSDFCIISTKATASESVPSNLSSKLTNNNNAPIVKTKKRVSFNDSLVQVHLIPNISSFLNVEKYNFNISSTSMTTESSIPSSEDEEHETSISKMSHSINTMINTNNNRIQQTEFYFDTKDMNTIGTNYNESNFIVFENNNHINNEKVVFELNDTNSTSLIVEPPSDILINKNQQSSNDLNYDASSLSSTTSSASSSSSLSANNNLNNNNLDQVYPKTVFNDENQTNYILNNLNNKRYKNYLKYQKNILLESNNELNNINNNNSSSVTSNNNINSNNNNNNNQQVFVFKSSTNLKNNSPPLQSQTNNFLNNNLSIIGNSKVIPKQQSISQLNSKNLNMNNYSANNKRLNPNYSQLFSNKRSLTSLSPTSLSNNQNSSNHPFILYDANPSSSNGDFLNTKQILNSNNNINNQNLHYLRQLKTRNSSNPPPLSSSSSTQTNQLSEFYAPNTTISSTTSSARSNSNSQKDVHPQLKFISNLKKLKPSTQSNQQILQNEYIPLIMETNMNKHHEPSNHYHKMMSDFQQERQQQSQKSINNSSAHTKYIFLKPDEQLYHSSPSNHFHNSTFNTRSHTIANINLDSKTSKKDLKSEIKELVENSNLNINNKSYDLSTLNQLVTLKDINYYLKNNAKYASANNNPNNNKSNRLNSSINNSNNFIHVNQNRNYPNLRQNVNSSTNNPGSVKPRTEINLMKLNAQINPDIVDSKRSTSALPLLRRQFSKKLNNFMNENSTINENNEYNQHNNKNNSNNNNSNSNTSSKVNNENIEQLTNNLNNLTKSFTNNQSSVPFTYKLFNSKMINNLTRAKTFICAQGTNNASSFMTEKSHQKSSRCASIDKTSL